MSTWTAEDLDRIGAADELGIAPNRADGSPGPTTTIWVVRVDGDLYVRSWRGRAGGWFRRAVRSHDGRVHAGGVDRRVSFEEHADKDREVIDAAYRAKYGRYGSTYVAPMVADDAAATTLRLVAR